jgi:hypothetical protein
MTTYSAISNLNRNTIFNNQLNGAYSIHKTYCLTYNSNIDLHSDNVTYLNSIRTWNTSNKGFYSKFKNFRTSNINNNLNIVLEDGTSLFIYNGNLFIENNSFITIGEESAQIKFEKLNSIYSVLLYKDKIKDILLLNELRNKSLITDEIFLEHYSELICIQIDNSKLSALPNTLKSHIKKELIYFKSLGIKIVDFELFFSDLYSLKKDSKVVTIPNTPEIITNFNRLAYDLIL